MTDFVDPFYDIFLRASSDGETIRGEDEWKDFFNAFLSSGLCSSNSDYRLIETIWLESCASSRAFSETANSEPTLSFDNLKSRILELHPVYRASEATSAASAVKLQAKNLTSLLNNWDPSQLDEEKTRQLLSVLYGLEMNHLAQQQSCENLSNAVLEKMQTTRSKALTTSNNDSGPSAAPSNTIGSALLNPLMHYKQNLSLIEKASVKHRVRSVRHQGSTTESRGRVSKDTFGFGQTFTDTNNIHTFKGQGREILISLSQLQEQCPCVLLNAFNLNAENCMIARQGTSTRLGRLLWGPLYDPSAGSGPSSTPKAFFRERECALLRAFGRILRSMLSSEKEEESLKRFVPSDSISVDVGALVEEEFRESDAAAQQPLVFAASVQVGQRLVIKLPPTTTVPHVQNDSAGALGSNVCWHAPIVGKVGGTSAGNGIAKDIPMQVVETNSSGMRKTLPIDIKGNASITLFASKAGLCDIQIPFYDPSMKTMPNANCVLSIACEVVKPPCSSTLMAIMRACLESQNQKEGFTTLRGLLDHRYFEALGVKDLEDVMSVYETQFGKLGGSKTTARAGERKNVL
ncbi:hypothetical protein TrRE_jg1796 [Triparma retinervis]|uniref:Uncharacterized protein n=1 Tax=Triparma retinervis TaxID=2557542 RepID=A0A9W7E2X7_9STRA|nr:hypothetical protein TrRE_jg1796 [Triparma retinervis]